MIMKANSVRIETLTHADESREDVPIHFIPNVLPPTISVRTLGTRAYLRRLRAAEMAAWELTGGDYLLSTCATRTTSV